MKTLDDILIVTQYRFKDDFVMAQREPITFNRMMSPHYSGTKWAVRRNGDCLSKDGEWEWEVSPSSRNNDFYKNFRFNSLEEAVVAATNAK